MYLAALYWAVSRQTDEAVTTVTAPKIEMTTSVVKRLRKDFERLNTGLDLALLVALKATICAKLLANCFRSACVKAIFKTNLR